jgi:release factor glutamine methyltransferase
MTIASALELGEQQLRAAGIESGRLETELMLAQLLDVPRLQLWLQREQSLTNGQHGKLTDWLARRATREPLQHILGWAPFLDLELHVNGDVLVPRPETELLAQLAIERLKRTQITEPRALDWGTGSGCLALAIAKAVPHSEVHALDISPDALRVARANAIGQGLADRVKFHLGNGFQALASSSDFPLPTSHFDLVVTNPPYIPSAEIATLQPEVRDHDPRLALDGGTDGLDCYRRLATEAKAWLRPDGCLLAEFGDGQAAALSEIFSAAGWLVESVEKDLSGRERVLIVRAPVRD